MNSTPATWERFRASMPITQGWAYWDHAAVAPLPQETVEAMTQWMREAATQGDTCWPRWSRSVDSLHGLVGELIGAREQEIALVPSTTAGINLVAEGYPWRDGDNVVILANEFPSNQYPWLNQARRGVQVRRVPVADGRVDLSQLREALDNRTRIVSVSWVGYASGYRLDVAEVSELVHRAGALLFLDAIQGLGVFPLDVHQSGVDFLAADGHKWMLGPEGAGLFFVRHELLDLLTPLGIGWNSVQRAFDYSHVEMKLRPTAARYEGGSQNIAGFLGLSASLQLLRRSGLGPRHGQIAERVLYVTELLCDRLRQIGAEVKSDRSSRHASGIVAFDLPGIPLGEARKQFERHGVVLSVRDGHLRASGHAYNDPSDIERLIEAAQAVARH